jgi:hypothetical protein
VTLVLRGAVVGTLAGAAALLPTGAAFAEQAERTGWWSRLSAGGAVLPAPTTAAGDLRVAQAPDGPAAYAAVLYPSAGSTAATLTLRLRGDRLVGTPDVLACVTADAQWPEGGNQPFENGPAYDCDLGSAFAAVDVEAGTLTFFLDATLQDTEGSWSLALVPAPDAAPFSLDVAAPEAGDFVAEASTGPEQGVEPEPFEPEPGGDGASSGSSGDAFVGTFEPPASFDTGSSAMPLLAGGDSAPLPEPVAPEPAVAGAAPAAAPAVLLARPAGVVDDLGAGRRLLGLLVLAGGSAAVGYAAGQQRPGPRLIGGRARAVPAAAAAPAAVPASAQERPRGIGRFAKVRDAAPRRLR